MTLPSPVVGDSEAAAAPVVAVASSRRRALRRLMHDGASVFLGTRYTKAASCPPCPSLTRSSRSPRPGWSPATTPRT